MLLVLRHIGVFLLAISIMLTLVGASLVLLRRLGPIEALTQYGWSALGFSFAVAAAFWMWFALWPHEEKKKGI